MDVCCDVNSVEYLRDIILNNYVIFIRGIMVCIFFSFFSLGYLFCL